jgi:dipeptidyl aminopeptidase/acylaminoacyl peptidase
VAGVTEPTIEPTADTEATQPAEDLNHFDDLAKFLEIPRVTGLALSPDGSRLAVGVQNLSPDGKKFISSVWEIDPDGGAPYRLTRSAAGESAPAFLPDGSLLFAAKRPDPDASTRCAGRRICTRTTSPRRC